MACCVGVDVGVRTGRAEHLYSPDLNATVLPAALVVLNWGMWFYSSAWESTCWWSIKYLKKHDETDLTPANCTGSTTVQHFHSPNHFVLRWFFNYQGNWDEMFAIMHHVSVCQCYQKQQSLIFKSIHVMLYNPFQWLVTSTACEVDPEEPEGWTDPLLPRLLMWFWIIIKYGCWSYSTSTDRPSLWIKHEDKYRQFLNYLYNVQWIIDF